MPKTCVQPKMISRSGFPGMKRLLIFIIVLTTLSGYAHAHSPSDVTVSYNESSGELGVVILHQVEDPAMHYVNHVTVKQGNSVLIDRSYISQPDTSRFTYRYSLPELKGSSGEIKVDVDCNQFGSRSGTLTLGATPAPTKAPACVFGALLAFWLALCVLGRTGYQI